MRKTTSLSLPGHPYNGRFQSGIKLDGYQVSIHQRGEPIKTATLSGLMSPWQFWYNSQFVRLFPDVTHWWFFSGWTQQVRLRVLNREGTGEINGLMQFVSDDSPGQMWFYDNGAISLPLPMGEEFPGNVPLRLALARLIYQAAVLNQVVQDQWYTVTSLIESTAVERAFPIEWKEPWWLDNAFDKNNMRASFCAQLGLQQTD